METAADFVTEVWSVMLVPPANMLLLVIWCAVWLFLAIYVYSTGEFSQAPGTAGDAANSKGVPYGKPYGTVTWTDEQAYMFYYFCFGFLWIAYFIDAMN